MGDRSLKPLDIPETASPGTPPAGFRRIYGKADGHTYGRDSAGTEVQLDNAASASSAVEARYEIASGETITIGAGKIMLVFGGLLNGGAILNGGRVVEVKQI